MKPLLEAIGLLAAVILPFWNIPLILRIRRRRSSADISLAWTVGVFLCLVLMLPAALLSPDRVFKTFSALNFILFGAVVVYVLRYRSRPAHFPTASKAKSR